jgi:hypothetical protein
VSPARATRTAASMVAVAVLALALVLGMWQRVDAACEGEDFDPEDPVTTCQGPEEFDLGRIAADPPVTPTSNR